jgi:hypothetical protein
MPNQLTYFEITGHWYNIDAPSTSGNTNQPQFLVISAFITFTPRLKPGTVVYVPNLDLGTTLLAPNNLDATPHTTGGTFTAGTYYWAATCTNPNGETTKSDEITATLTGSTSSATLTWDPVDDVTVNLYRGTAPGVLTTRVATITDEATTTYTDTGAAGTPATPPTTNTAQLSANTAVAITPITARILQGELQTINREDTPDLQLLANTSLLGLAAPLIYDVSYSNVVYAAKGQTLTPFAFTAPTDNTPLDLTDPALTRLKYDPTNYV